MLGLSSEFRPLLHAIQSRHQPPSWRRAQLAQHRHLGKAFSLQSNTDRRVIVAIPNPWIAAKMLKHGLFIEVKTAGHADCSVALLDWA